MPVVLVVVARVGRPKRSCSIELTSPLTLVSCAGIDGQTLTAADDDIGGAPVASTPTRVGVAAHGSYVMNVCWVAPPPSERARSTSVTFPTASYVKASATCSPIGAPVATSYFSRMRLLIRPCVT